MTACQSPLPTAKPGHFIPQVFGGAGNRPIGIEHVTGHKALTGEPPASRFVPTATPLPPVPIPQWGGGRSGKDWTNQGPSQQEPPGSAWAPGSVTLHFQNDPVSPLTGSRISAFICLIPCLRSVWAARRSRQHRTRVRQGGT